MNKLIGRYPDSSGHFGPYGGRFVGETLMTALLDVEAAWKSAKSDPAFLADFRAMLRDYAGRPTPLDFAERLSDHVGGARLWLKREDCTHTGAHKINNVVGQGLLARRMGKKRVIAETGAGQHGVATATIAARFGFDCKVFMGAEDIRRQAPNVRRMELLGAQVIPVTSGTSTLRAAIPFISSVMRPDLPRNCALAFSRSAGVAACRKLACAAPTMESNSFIKFS